MRKFILFFLCTLMALSLFSHTAEARRFGGGKSFGMQRASHQYSRPNSAGSSAYANKPSSSNKWLGALTGMAIGGLLASLFMGHGIGTGILSWVLMAGLGFLIWQFIRTRFAPQTNAAQYNMPLNNQAINNSASFNTPAYTPTAIPRASYPIGFNENEFIRQAKVNFMRLQTAYDDMNILDLREFTTPEIFAEIQMQLQERGQTENHTEVVSLHAELLDVEETLDKTIASVRFTGEIREATNGPVDALSEIWHFAKLAQTSSWKVAGIQQH